MDNTEVNPWADTRHIQVGDLVLMVGNDRKTSIVRMQTGQEFQTHHGVLSLDDVIGRRWGDSLDTHLGYTYMLLPPSLDDLVRNIKRSTQIIYPKEIGYMLMKMNIGPGTRVLEAGTGSGGHILCASNAITASVPLGNYVAAVNAYRDFFALPRVYSVRRRKNER